MELDQGFKIAGIIAVAAYLAPLLFIAIQLTIELARGLIVYPYLLITEAVCNRKLYIAKDPDNWEIQAAQTVWAMVVSWSALIAALICISFL